MKQVDPRIDFFNDLADGWDGMTSSPPEDRLKAIVSLAELQPPSSVLDVGCGTGVLVATILEAIGDHGRLFAIDPAPRMLDLLKTNHADGRIETLVESMESCSLPQSSLDAVICFSCFPHVSNKPAALENVRRMLKRNGHLVIAHVSSREEINAFHASCSGPVRHDVLPDEKEMRWMIEDVGLTTIHFADESGRYELVARK